MLAEICALGFRRVELGHGIRLSLWEGVEAYLGGNDVEVTSMHNFCPLPLEILRADPDCYQCTSHRSEERERAQRFTRQTLEHAARLKVTRVVLHLGSVPIAAYTERLVGLAAAGLSLSRKYVRTKLAALKAREGFDYLDRVRDWLLPLAAYGRELGITLGVENRIGIETFPSEREFIPLLDTPGLENVGYWHDFGHAQVRANLHWIDHRQWLEGMVPRLVGCHIHDVQFPDADHLPPGLGMVAFPGLLPLLPNNLLMVWEMAPRTLPAEIVTALGRWQERFPSP